MSHTLTPPRRSLAVRLAVPALAVAAACALVAPSAQAAGAPAGQAAQASARTPSRTAPASEQRAVSKLDVRSIVRTAKPLPLPANVPTAGDVPARGANGPAFRVPATAARTTGTGGGTALPSPQAGAARTTTTSALAAAAGWDGAVWPGGNIYNPNRQVGKLYFDTDPGAGYRWSWCTATVITSENRSTLLTAGHCVWNIGARRWYQNAWFYPGYQYGASTLGAWPVRLMSTTWNYYNSGTSADDMAVALVTRDSAGVGIVDRLGAMGISFNAGVGRYRSSFGYPITDSRWPGYVADGEDLRYCQGYDTYYGSGSFAGQMLLSCLMTGGASGGPWLTDVRSDWLGWANSVNSNKGGVGTAWRYYMFGPYFGNEEAAVFNSYRNA